MPAAPDSPVALVLAAVLLDWLLGDPRWLPHPVVGIGRLIAWLEPRLRKLGSLRLAGVLLVLLTLGLTLLAGWGALTLAAHLHPWLGFAAGVWLGYSCLAARSLHRESALVADALTAGDLPAARHFLSRIVGRETAELEESEVWRGAVETVAENTADGVIAPLLCLLLGGPLLALAYKAVNTLDSMVGYKNERYLQFGWAAARLDDLVNWLPARLTALAMVLAAPLLGLSGRDAWRILRRDGAQHSSPNAGRPEAAAAGALGVQLGGANRYFGQLVAKPTIGEPRRPLDRAAWLGSVRLLYGAEALLLLVWLAWQLARSHG